MRELLPTLDLEPPPPPPPSVHPQKSNLPMLYYGLVIVGTAAIVLAIYNLIIIKWCSSRRQNNRQQTILEITRSNNNNNMSTSQSFEGRNLLLSSFKYKKDMNIKGQEDQNCEYECPVCLSVFEEGEEVRQLPRCKHSFHAPCIDMWLFSHSDCPLCRASVVDNLVQRCQRPPRTVVEDTPEHSREGLLVLGSSISV